MKNFYRLILLAVAAAVSASIQAEIPAGYYSSLAGKRDGELKTALHNLIYNHTQVSSYNALPDYFRRTDVYPPDNEN